MAEAAMWVFGDEVGEDLTSINCGVLRSELRPTRATPDEPFDAEWGVCGLHNRQIEMNAKSKTTPRANEKIGREKMNASRRSFTFCHALVGRFCESSALICRKTSIPGCVILKQFTSVRDLPSTLSGEHGAPQVPGEASFSRYWLKCASPSQSHRPTSPLRAGPADDRPRKNRKENRNGNCFSYLIRAPNG